MRARVAQACLAALLAAIGCASATGFTPIPKSQDVAMGREYSQEVDKQLPVINDPKASEGIVRIAQSILAANKDRAAPYEWEFKVVRDDGTVNAFALPGGKIYVFTGLIARADDEAEVAGVLAHEIAHVTERHSAERMTDQLGAQVVQQILLGNRAPLVQAAGALVTNIGFLAYSRGQESEADEKGLEFLSKTDYDPKGMVRFFQKIAALEAKGSSTVSRFLTDHPRSEDRIRDTEKRIAELPPEKQTGQQHADRWLAYRDGIAPKPRNAPEVLPPAPPKKPGA